MTDLRNRDARRSRWLAAAIAADLLLVVMQAVACAMYRAPHTGDAQSYWELALYCAQNHTFYPSPRDEFALYIFGNGYVNLLSLLLRLRETYVWVYAVNMAFTQLLVFSVYRIMRRLCEGREAACAAVTLLCLVGLYRLEYCYDLTDTAEMKEIIREDLVSISGFPYHGEVDVLETATLKDRMFVLYRLEQNGTFERQGIYQFQRGLFGGYRFRSREYDTCPIVNTSLIQIGRQRYLEIYTANWPKEAASFRVFPGYRPPAYDGEEEILPDISTLAPVYEGTAAKSILQVIPVTEEQVKAGFFGSMSVAYYDAEGSQLDTGELIKLYRNSEGGSGGGGGGNGAIWPVDVFQVILVILGIIMTRYFLCPEPKKERKDHL